jgi:hypothetical protein
LREKPVAVGARVSIVLVKDRVVLGDEKPGGGIALEIILDGVAVALEVVGDLGLRVGTCATTRAANTSSKWL